MTLKTGTLKALSDLDTAFGWNAPGAETDLKDVLTELQGFRVSMVKGAAQSILTKVLNIGGISTGAADEIAPADTILAAVEFRKTGASGLNTVSIRNDVSCRTTVGYVKFSGAATTGNFVLLFWWDKTGFIAQ